MNSLIYLQAKPIPCCQPPLILFSRAILAFTLLGLLALVTFGPSLLGAFGGGSGSGSYGNYNRNGFDYYE